MPGPESSACTQSESRCQGASGRDGNTNHRKIYCNLADACLIRGDSQYITNPCLEQQHLTTSLGPYPASSTLYQTDASIARRRCSIPPRMTSSAAWAPPFSRCPRELCPRFRSAGWPFPLYRDGRCSDLGGPRPRPWPPSTWVSVYHESSNIKSTISFNLTPHVMLL